MVGIVGSSQNEFLGGALSRTVSLVADTCGSTHRNEPVWVVDLEPSPAKAIDELWTAVIKEIESEGEGRQSQLRTILFFSAINERQLESELNREARERLRFLRESCVSEFYCPFCRPSKSLQEILNGLIERAKLARGSYAGPLAKIVAHARSHHYSWANSVSSAVERIAGKAGSREARLSHEHDMLTDINRIDGKGDFVEDQAVIDYYYLAIYGTSSPSTRTVVCIDDQPDQFDDFLKVISEVTGDRIYYTADSESARECVGTMCSDSPSLSGRFKLVGEDKHIYKPKDIGNADWLLMDLLIKDEAGVRQIAGFDVLARYMERSPETPAILLTWSEEPDVAAEAMCKSNAVCVVPKRRMLRIPYEMHRYLNQEVGPIIDFLKEPPSAGEASHDSQDLRTRMLQAFRLWKAYPGILWHGEKTVHIAEHSLEHSMGLWRITNQLLPFVCKHVSRKYSGYYSQHLLFRFLMAIWLHDIGSKGNETYQMADQVRNRHAWIAGELIQRNPELYLLHRGEEADFVALLCSYHQSCAPFKKGSKPKDTVRGLYQVALADIEAKSGWKLTGWAALLRLIDAMEHNWRRVGITQLMESKQISTEMDSRYYHELGMQSVEAENYAKMLDGQSFHMKKHRSVLQLSIRTGVIDSEGLIVFWPEYEFIDHKTACSFMPEISRYALEEWVDTGELIRDRLGIRLLEQADFENGLVQLSSMPNSGSSRVFAVWNPGDDAIKELKARENDLKSAESAKDKAECKRLLNDLAREIWTKDCALCNADRG